LKMTLCAEFFYSLNAAVWGIFGVAEFWGKVAKPPQNEAKQKMSL
jgi:hypothetical protein